jgi:hypothetical protein
MWDALVDLIRSYVARNRADTQQIEGKKPFPEGRYAFITAYSTAAAAFLALIAAIAFWCQFGAMNEATVEANRGWLVMNSPQLVRRQITPYRMTLDTDMKLANIGNGPAFNVSSFSEGFWFKTTLHIRGRSATMNMAEQHFGPNNTCKSAETGADRGTIWQKQLPDPISGGGGVEPPPSFYNDFVTYGYRGCVIYKVFGEVKYTRFCEFLAPDPKVPITQWKWSFCVGPKQNDAS